MDSSRMENSSAGNTFNEQSQDAAFMQARNRSKQVNTPHNVSRMSTAMGSMGQPLMSGFSKSTGQHMPHQFSGPSKRYGSNFEDYRA